MTRLLLHTALALTAVAALAAPAAAQAPEPNAIAQLVGSRPCALDVDDDFEKRFYELEGWSGPNWERYPGACQRLKFSYGPIGVKPGQNDVLIGPVTIEKPVQDGYITRFKPNLVRADGSVPPVEQVHLHHGTWLAAEDYGSGPFFAAGEEKTIAPWPKGYGMPIESTDTWLLLYMVHSAVSEPFETFITYEIDFVPKAEGDRLGMKPAYPVWLDVRPSAYPVFNVHRKFGGKDQECTWPREQCADFDPFGKKFVGQGEPGNGVGEDFELPKLGEPLGKIDKFTGGTIIGIGGHLHPGGLQNEIDLVRPGGEQVDRTERYREKVRRRAWCVKRKRGGACRKWTRKRPCVKRRRVKGAKRKRCVKRARKFRTVWRERRVTGRQDTTRIYNGRARYWDRNDRTKWGGPPTSWDFSMEVMGLPRWGVRVQPGDKLRSNATYETKHAASYENMGIAVAILAPHDENGNPTAPGVNPFQADREEGEDCSVEEGKFCQTGVVTHGHYKENGNHTVPTGQWDGEKGQRTNEVGIANFLYLPGDLSTRSMTGIPQVKLGTNLRFTNAEGASIYHTITSCKFPCLGPTGASFPLPNGETSLGRALDIDSSELGVGPPAIGAPKQRLDWTLPVTKEEGYKPGETVTYFCRVHPFMRGAFEVTE